MPGGCIAAGIPEGLDKFERNVCHYSIRNVAVNLLFTIPQNKRNHQGLDKFHGYTKLACNVTHMNKSCNIYVPAWPMRGRYE